MYIAQRTRVHDSSNVLKWLPWNNPLLRHRYSSHKVTPHPYIIAIYRTYIYCKLDSATWRSRDHYSILFIARVLLGQTITDSFYVSRWLPWSNPIYVIYMFFQRVTLYPYVIAIYRTCLYWGQDIAKWRSRDHDSILFIVRVLLGHTINDSSYVYKWLQWSNPVTSSIWLPWSNPPVLCNRYL